MRRQAGICRSSASALGEGPPGGLDQCEALVHTPLLEGPVGLFLGEPVPLHEQGLGTSDEILL